MHNPFDQLAKRVGKGALDASGPTLVQYEVSRDAQHADLRHDPDPARRAERARLGLLGRIAASLCLIDVFAHAPGAAELRACLSKHLAHWEDHARSTRARNRRRKEKGLPPVAAIEPILWIIAAKVSAPMLRRLDVAPAPSFPPGVYSFGGDLLRARLVVASELPRDRSTLLVRLMAAGPQFADAIADLAALPPDAHERTVAEGVLVHLQRSLAKKPSASSEEEELIVRIIGGFEDYREKGRAEGLREGQRKARVEVTARAVLTVLEARGIAVSKASRERILAQTDTRRLERWLKKAAVADSVAEVIGAPS